MVNLLKISLKNLKKKNKIFLPNSYNFPNMYNKISQIFLKISQKCVKCQNFSKYSFYFQVPNIPSRLRKKKNLLRLIAQITLLLSLDFFMKISSVCLGKNFTSFINIWLKFYNTIYLNWQSLLLCAYTEASETPQSLGAGKSIAE